MLSLTQKAHQKLIEIATADACACIVRAKLSGGGCAGFTTEFFFDDEDKISDIDEVFDHDGVRIVVDQMSLQYLDGSEIDYLEDLVGGGFKFNNPKSSGSCGCGNSVSF